MTLSIFIFSILVILLLLIMAFVPLWVDEVKCHQVVIVFWGHSSSTWDSSGHPAFLIESRDIAQISMCMLLIFHHSAWFEEKLLIIDLIFWFYVFWRSQVFIKCKKWILSWLLFIHLILDAQLTLRYILYQIWILHQSRMRFLNSLRFFALIILHIICVIFIWNLIDWIRFVGVIIVFFDVDFLLICLFRGLLGKHLLVLYRSTLTIFKQRTIKFQYIFDILFQRKDITCRHHFFEALRFIFFIWNQDFENHVCIMLNFWIYQIWFCHQFWSQNLVQNIVLLWDFVEWCLDKLIFVKKHIIFAQFWDIGSIYSVVCCLRFFLEVILHELDFLVLGLCGTYPSTCWVWHGLLVLSRGASVFEILGFKLSLRLRWGDIGHIHVLGVNFIQLPGIVLISPFTLKCNFVRIRQMHWRARVPCYISITTAFRFLDYHICLYVLSVWRKETIIIGNV